MASVGGMSKGTAPVGGVSQGPAAPHKSPEDRRLYRLDFVFAESGGSQPTTRNYTLNLEEENVGEIHLGSNIVLSSPSHPRMDVGFLLRCHFTPVADDLVLQSKIELSSMDENSSIRKMSVNGDALVPGGKSTLVASIEDPGSHQRYQVTVTATRLR
jgi:hypothetical protein